MFYVSYPDLLENLDDAFWAYDSVSFSVVVFAFLLFCFCYGFATSRRHWAEARLWRHLWRGYAVALGGVLVVTGLLVVLALGAWLTALISEFIIEPIDDWF